MVVKRRNGFQIAGDILEVCLEGANKTRVVYRANLNSVRVNNYLEAYVHLGMLAREMHGGCVVYRTTCQGVRFLESYFGRKFVVRSRNGA